MGEFIYQESKMLFRAITRGEAIEWPTKCRNCDCDFPDDLKREIYQVILANPIVDLLKVTSQTFMKRNPRTNYCCINNFKPHFPHSIDEIGVPECYRTIRGVVVEEGLTEWYDITWEGDDENEDDELKPQNSEFSFFNIVGE